MCSPPFSAIQSNAPNTSNAPALIAFCKLYVLAPIFMCASGLVHRRAFPYGTFAVNIIGAYMIGLIMELGMRSTLIPDTVRLGLTVGFLGGLTTFSTFSYETFTLLEDGRFMVAGANVLASVAVCLLFTWLGIVTIRTLV